MKTLTILTITGLAILPLNGSAFAGKVHTLDELYEAERQAQRAVALGKHLLKEAPALFQKIKKNHAQQKAEKIFPGHGHKLGGDKYTNRLLGIDHKEGKQLAKKARDNKEKQSVVKQVIKETPFNFTFMDTRFSAFKL